MNKGPLWLRTTLAANGVQVSDGQMEQLENYCRLLLDWNSKINLISRRSEETIWEEQIFHSISFLGWCSLHNSTSVIDIGTGGGLPGIPLKILRPDLSLTLLDSIRKKVDAVGSILMELGMTGIGVECCRAEDVLRTDPTHRRYDYVVCRGVGDLLDLWSYGYPLLRNVSAGQVVPDHISKGIRTIPPGALLALKGGDITEEVQAVKRKNKDITITVIEIKAKTEEPSKNPEKKIAILQKRTGC